MITVLIAIPTNNVQTAQRQIKDKWKKLFVPSHIDALPGLVCYYDWDADLIASFPIWSCS